MAPVKGVGLGVAICTATIALATSRASSHTASASALVAETLDALEHRTADERARALGSAFTRFGFREVLEKGAAAILQPDVSHAGGISETRKIAAMAETYYAAVAPHCPLGPIALAACLQVDACTPSFLCQEQVCLGEGYLKEPFVNDAGHIAVPKGPGLGIEVDKEAVLAKQYDGSWSNPRLWHEDGSLADW